MSERFESYLRRAGELARQGDDAGAEGFERLARQTLEQLGSPPQLESKLHAARAERALRAGDHDTARAALSEALAALEAAGRGGGREQFELQARLARAHASAGDDELAVAAFDDAIALGARIGPAYHPAAHTHIGRAEALRRLGRDADAEQSLRAALAIAEHAPDDARRRILLSARGTLAALRPDWAAEIAERERPRARAQADDHDDGTPGAGRSPRPKPGPRAPRAVDERAFDDVLAELDALIGLVDVKAEVRRLAELLRIASLRRAAGLRTVSVSLHVIFEGAPGTGKTTVARLFGRLYKSLGLLATDNVIEVTREDLVSGYVGQTAMKTDEVIDRALDGVLFIDEAYALVRPQSHGDFGPEALAELLKRMEDERSRLAVIAAGYPHEMQEFLASNSGFHSRFGETIHFADYAPDELVAIFESFAAAADYALTPDARVGVLRVMERLHAVRDRYFGNARAVRNLFDDVVSHQAERLLRAGGAPSRDALIELQLGDVRAASGSDLGS